MGLHGQFQISFTQLGFRAFCVMQEQGIVSPEEWDVFNGVLRKPLPAAFRINAR